MNDQSYIAEFAGDKVPLLAVRAGKVFANSRDVAEKFEKRHDSVLRSIRDLMSMDPDLGLHNFVETPYVDPQNSQTYQSFDMDREGFELLAMGFTGQKAFVWKRTYVRAFRMMEEQLQTRALPNFSDPVAAARAWADQFEARQIADRTKAEIGHRREATAMNTASQAVKRANKLELELDRSREYATVKRMSMLYHGQEFQWRTLKHVSAEMGVPPIDVFDANYGTVKAYHADVWREAYALDIPEGSR